METLPRSTTSDSIFTTIRPSEDFHCGQVPGYLGFCPQVKYNYGKTFTNQTRDLAQNFPHRHIEHKIPVDFVDKFHNPLPEPSGQNRYTRNIIPGYSGFVPEMTQRHSKTYTRLANECVDNFIDRNKEENRRMANLQMAVAESDQLAKATIGNAENQPNFGPYGKFKDIDPGSLSRRKADEAPIPGYTGHVPRIHTTQIGVGSRYHVVSDDALDDFWTRYQLKFGEQFPGDIQASHPVKWPTQSFVDDSIRKAYYQEGVIPKFRGHVPQANYRNGRTFGDTTRQLDVCKHPFETYGEFLRRCKEETTTADQVKHIAAASAKRTPTPPKNGIAK